MNMEIYGAVRVRGQDFHDDEIGTINPNQRLIYGIDWKYLGDQFWEESNIAVGDNYYGGRNGLREALIVISTK
jgi:hypothetical protein